MKLKKLLIPVLAFIIIISTLGLTASKEAKRNTIEDILSNCGCEVQAYGLTVSFSTKTDLEKNEEATRNIAKYLCKDENGQKTTISTKENNLCIDFSTDNSNGYIESLTSDGENSISININVEGNQKNPTSLKSKIEKAIYSSGAVSKENLKYFDYIKANIKSKNLGQINESIIEIIKKNGGENIQTVKLDNGYSNIALTGQYESINVGGKREDLNFALMNYNANSSMGCYLIIGTPEITISY